MDDRTDDPDQGDPFVPGAVPLGAGRRRVLISTSSVMSSNLLVALLGAVLLRIMTTRLSQSSFGEWVAALALVSTATLISDLGVNALTGREIARTPERAEEILGHTLGLRITLSVLLIPIVSLIGYFAYSGSKTTLLYCVIVASFAIPFDALRAVSLSYFVAGIRNHVAAVIATFQQVVMVVIVIVILVLGGGVVLCLAAYFASTAISAVVAYVWARREVRFRPQFKITQWKAIVAGSIGIGLIQLINVLYLKADTLILSVISTTKAVGIYGVAYAIINFFGGIGSITMTSLLPILTRAEDSELGGLVDRACRHLATVAVLLAMLTCSFGAILIRVVAPPKYASADLPLSILAVALVFTFLHVTLGVASVARNRHMRIVYVSMFCLGINVATNLFAIPIWGINGAASATFISEAFALAGVAWVFRRDVGPHIPLVRILARPVLVGTVLAVVFHVGLGSDRRGLVVATGMALVQVSIFFGALYASGGLPEEYAGAVSAVRRRLRPSATA